MFEYEEAAFSFVSTVFEVSTCVENDQPSESSGVVSWLGILGIAVLVVLLIVVTIFTYSAWLYGYAPTTADAEAQTEAVDSPRAVPVAPITVDRTDSAAAPPVVVACPNGSCFHLPGCRYTITRTAHGRIVKTGIISYKRCSVGMPASGKHRGHAPARMSYA